MNITTVDVVCAVLEDRGRFFIARRAGHKAMAGFWEFPGGKVESGESHQEALARELREELGITVSVGAFVATTEERHDLRLLRLHCYRAQWLDGELRLLDHDDYRWVEKASFADYLFCPPDRPFLLSL